MQRTIASLITLALVGGCDSANTTNTQKGTATSTTTAQCIAAGQGTATYANFALGFFDANCVLCHSTGTSNRNGAPVDVNFDTLAAAQTSASRADRMAGMNPSPGGQKNTLMPPAIAPTSPTDLQRQQLACWVAAGTPAAATCDQYCATLVATCTGADKQYDDETLATCLAGCGTVYAYALNDDKGKNDDLSCRLNHAGLASAAKAAANAGNVTLHCGHAGPTGLGRAAAGGAASSACGPPCDVYCDLQERNCTGVNSNFADHATCLAQCNPGGVSGATVFNTTGTVGATGGDSYQCRIWHLGKAQANPATHCQHTRIVSAGTPPPCAGAVQ